MIRRQGFRFRLKPRVSQAPLLLQFLGCSRFVWNAILAENRYRYEEGDPLPLTYVELCARLKLLKGRHMFLQDAHSQPLQQTLRDLARAYQAAFDPKLAAKMPKFKKKGHAQGIRFPQGFKVERNGVYLPKIGWVAFRLSARTRKRRMIEGTIKSVTVRLEARCWYVTFQTEREVPEPIHENADSAVGIDLGVAQFAALSDGSFVEGANPLKKHEQRLAFLQRRLSRKAKFSANWRKAKARITKLSSRIAAVRNDVLHKASATISKNHATVVMENLRIVGMTKSAKGTIEAPGRNVRAKARLNQRILDQGWGEFRRQLAYKLAWKGGRLLLVDPRNTSRTCSTCGHVSSENRLTQAAFACVACGYASNADTNAAKNILGRAGWARIACGDSPLGESSKQEARCAA
jgi:putative transposase